MDRLRILLTPVVVALALASNAIPWNGRRPADADDGRATALDPAPWAFSIWVLIFALQVVWAVYTVLPRNRENAHLRRTGWPALAVVALSGLWPVLAAYDLHVVGTAVILLMGVLLVVVDVRGDAVLGGGTGADFWCARLPFSIERGWVAAAAAVAVTAVLQHDFRLSGAPLDPVEWGAAFVIALGVVGVIDLFQRGDLPCVLAIAWALFAIAVDKGFSGAIGGSATVFAVALAVLVPGRSLYRRARHLPRHPPPLVEPAAAH